MASLRERLQSESKSILKSQRAYRHRVHQFYRAAVATCEKGDPETQGRPRARSPTRILKGVHRILSRGYTRVRVRVR